MEGVLLHALVCQVFTHDDSVDVGRSAVVEVVYYLDLDEVVEVDGVVEEARGGAHIVYSSAYKF